MMATRIGEMGHISLKTSGHGGVEGRRSCGMLDNQRHNFDDCSHLSTFIRQGDGWWSVSVEQISMISLKQWLCVYRRPAYSGLN
jgi:hypothetical protein